MLYGRIEAVSVRSVVAEQRHVHGIALFGQPQGCEDSFAKSFQLIDQYVEMLNGDSEASSRFWALEERLNRDKLSSGVIANDIRRRTMHSEIANLLIDSVITLDDLDGFTEDIKSYAQHWIGQ